MVDRSIRAAIIEAYHGECQYCRKSGANHVEHIVPQARGGTDDLSNLTLACQWCNTRKAAERLPPHYEGLLLAIARKRVKRILRLVDDSAPDGKWHKLYKPGSNDIIMVWVSNKPGPEDMERMDRAMAECRAGAAVQRLAGFFAQAS